MEKIVSWRPHDVGMDRICLTTKGIFAEIFGDEEKMAGRFRNCA